MNYFFRRFLSIPLMLIGVTLLVFTISNIIPADPARVAAGLNAPEEQVERLREEMGLNDPIWERYANYLKGLLRGDMGRSMVSRRPVAEQIKIFLPATLELIFFASIMFLIFGTLFGVFSAFSSRKWGVFLSKLFSFTGMSIPVFWLALILQVIFSHYLGWFPYGGRMPSGAAFPAITRIFTLDSILAGDLELFIRSIYYLFLPAFTLALGRFGATARFVNSSMKESLNQDYIRTARSKGLSEFIVVFKHALKNALIPVITMSGLQIGWMLGGTVLVEAIFSWPGIGLYGWRAIVSLDFMPIMGVTIVFASAFILINFIVDILYGILDPRIEL